MTTHPEQTNAPTTSRIRLREPHFDLKRLGMIKQKLGWTRPRLRSPEATDRWTWLIIAAHTKHRRVPAADALPAGALSSRRVSLPAQVAARRMAV
ncbi:MAG: hypothetical protein JF597_48375 [Streptomyces sp.]|jgi:hypothetical protein|nr:hypothetical protein [Streptomyces sp.]